jgi:alpha-L-rhamnosidase
MHKMSGLLWAASVLLLCRVAGAGDAHKGPIASIRVKELKAEHIVWPLGIETPHPRLGWLLESRDRGQLQTAYQVLAASSLEKAAVGESGQMEQREDLL